MTFLETILSEHLIRPVGWTLVHFLWQGLLAALLLWVLLRIVRKASANVRYIIACAALLVLVCLPAATFCVLYEPPVETAVLVPAAETAESAPAMPAAKSVVIVETAAPMPTPKASLTSFVCGHIETALPWCVLGWFVGVVMLSVWYLGGWCQLQKLRRIGTQSVAGAVEAKASELAARLGIRRGVQIVESALVQVPTVIGWLKPIILLPATALTGLDEVQLSALIAHELAHVKRCDYLVNILQTIVEILGFYHPALWWMSRQIRLERENCCDDMAVALLQNKKDYAGALFTMETIRHKQLELAVAANGGSLTSRISRLAGKETTSKQKSGWIPSVLTLIAIMLLLGSAFAINSVSAIPSKKQMAGLFEELNQASQSGDIHAVLPYFYFEDEEVKQKAMPYIKDMLGNASLFSDIHILNVISLPDGAYQVRAISSMMSSGIHVPYPFHVVFDEGRYKLNLFTQDFFDRIELVKTKSPEEIGRLHIEKQLTEWKNAAGEELDKRIQSLIRNEENNLAAWKYAKAHQLELPRHFTKEEVEKRLNRFKDTPPEQLKRDMIVELSEALSDDRNNTSGKLSKNSKAQPSNSETGSTLEFRLLAELRAEQLERVNWPESDRDGYQWMKVRKQETADWNKSTPHRQINDEIYVLLSDKPDETMLADGSWGLAQTGLTADGMGKLAISIDFDEPAQEKFYALTQTHIKRQLALCLDGEVISAPTIMSAIRSRAIITGNFTEPEAKAIVEALKNGMPPTSQEEKPDSNQPKSFESMSAFEKLSMSEAALPDEVRDIYEVLEKSFYAAKEKDFARYEQCLASQQQSQSGRDSFQDYVELMRLNPDWKLLLLSVYWDADAALAVVNKLKFGNSQVAGPETPVFRLEKEDGHWFIVDVDLEEPDGLQIENARFLKENPGAGTWYIEPGRGPRYNQPGANSVVLLPSIRMVLDLTTGKIVKVPLETKSQAECLAYARQHCGCGVMFDHDGKLSHLGFINASGVNRPTKTQGGVEMFSFESANVPQAVIVTAKDGTQYSLLIRKAENEGAALEYERVNMEKLNLKYIGRACRLYAHDHDGRLPNELEELVTECDLSPKYFVSPRKPADFDGPSYILIQGLTNAAADHFVLACENPKFDSDKYSVLFADGHVAEMDRASLGKSLMETLDSLGETPQKKQWKAEAEQARRMANLRGLAVAWRLYAEDNDGDLAESMEQLKPYLKEAMHSWLQENAVLLEFMGNYNDIRMPSQTPIAYDKTFLAEYGRRIVAFADGHSETDDNDGLKELLDKAIETTGRIKKMHTLMDFGSELWVWANQHEDTLPDSIEQMEFEKPELKEWAKANVEYLGKGKVLPEIENGGQEVIAYDKSLLETANGTNLLFADGHVEFRKKDKNGVLVLYPEGKKQPWEKAFYNLYRLEEGEILKRIAPPFIPERKDFYVARESTQAKLIPEPPDYFAFHWDGKLKSWGLAFGDGSGNTLAGVLSHCFSISVDQFEGPDELLKFRMPGDWIVREDIPDADKLRALEILLREDFNRKISFDKQKVKRLVIVGKGTYKFSPPTGTYNDRKMHFYSDKLDANEGSGGGTADTVHELISVLGQRTGLQVIDETENSAQSINQPYGHHRSSRLRGIKGDGHQTDRLKLMLKNLEKQTNLTFTIEERMVSKWFVIDNSDNQPAKSPPVMGGRMGGFGGGRSGASGRQSTEIHLPKSPKTDQLLQEQLNRIIDLSALKGGVPLSQAIQHIQNSVDPPLPIVVDWDDLKEKTGILPTEKTRPYGWVKTTVDDALWYTLFYVSKDKELPVEYIIENNQIVIRYNPFNLVRKTYQLNPELSFDATGKSIPQDHLRELIIYRLFPHLGQNPGWRQHGHPYRGDIILENSKFTALATRERHVEIAEKLANLKPFDMRQVIVETRVLLVDDNYMEDVGLESLKPDYTTTGGVGQLAAGPANSQEILAALESKPLPESDVPIANSRTLEDLQGTFLTKAAAAHRNVKTLTAPKAMVLNGESACMKIVTSNRYKNIDDHEEDVETGITLNLEPTIQTDGKSVLVRGHLKYADILEWQKQNVNGKDYEIPDVQISNIPICATIENGGTILIEGPELTTTVTVEKNPKLKNTPVLQRFSNRSMIVDKQRMLIMIKPTVIEKEEAEPAAIEALAPEHNGQARGGRVSGRGVFRSGSRSSGGLRSRSADSSSKPTSTEAVKH